MTWFVITPSDSDLMHHGVKGQKWGVRRYQNKDGSLTALGKSRSKSREFTEEEKKFLTKKKSFYEIDNPEDRKRVFDDYVRKYGTNPSKTVRQEAINKNTKKIEEHVEASKKIMSSFYSLPSEERRRILDVKYGYVNKKANYYPKSKPGDDAIFESLKRSDEHDSAANYYYNENQYLRDPNGFVWNNIYPR